jgi:chromate reductase
LAFAGGLPSCQEVGWFQSYNYAISGVMKNAIDWASRPSQQLVARGSLQPTWARPPARLVRPYAQSVLWQVMVSLNMFLNQPEVMIGAADQRFDTLRKLTVEETTKYVGLSSRAS